jgi:hypothetical protein
MHVLVAASSSCARPTGFELIRAKSSVYVTDAVEFCAPKRCIRSSAVASFNRTASVWLGAILDKTCSASAQDDESNSAPSKAFMLDICGKVIVILVALSDELAFDSIAAIFPEHARCAQGRCTYSSCQDAKRTTKTALSNAKLVEDILPASTRQMQNQTPSGACAAQCAWYPRPLQKSFCRPWHLKRCPSSFAHGF